MKNFKPPLPGEGNMNWCTAILLGASLLLATACDSNKKPLHPDFGNSVHQNMLVHIIRPRIPHPDAALTDLDGARAFRAIDRYHRGETEKPKAETTTSSPGGGGNK
jgi:hypothetical protein